MAKIKVLHFPIRNSNGGVTRSALKFWKYINHDQFQFDFATCSPRLDFEQDIIDQGCGVHYISCYAEQDSRQFCEELKGILVRGYDAIHLNTNWWKSFYAEQAAREVGIKKIIVHARNTSIDVGDTVQREWEASEHNRLREAFPVDLCTDFLACSHAAADFLFGSRIPGDRIVILHNALDIGRYTYDESRRGKMREILDLSDKFVIGCVGRMSYQKNHQFLVECFNEVQKVDGRAVLMLLGDGELKVELEDMVRSYGIGDKVLFLGSVDNVEDYLQAMDVFAFPSYFEGLPNAMIEAQAAGLKCICSNAVTEEAGITDNVDFLDLDIRNWADAIMNYAAGYDREKVDDQIRAAGYDIKYEIKKLEEIYSGVGM